MIVINENHESWITLMMAITEAKEKPDLRKDIEKRLSPEVLCAADECTDYEDFKRRLEQYLTEGLPDA